MNPFDATHLAGLLPERRSRLDVDEPGAWHEAIALGSDLLVQRPRPIVADLVGPGRMGLARSWRRRTRWSSWMCCVTD